MLTRASGLIACTWVAHMGAFLILHGVVATGLKRFCLLAAMMLAADRLLSQRRRAIASGESADAEAPVG